LDAKLYELMLDRIRNNALIQPGRPKTPAVAARDFDGPVAFVQLLHGRDVAWTLGAVTGSRRTRYFDAKLDLGRRRLRELRDYIYMDWAASDAAGECGDDRLDHTAPGC